TYRVTPGGVLRGTIDVPGDKSISHRSLMFTSIARGESLIENLLESEDCLATRDALLALGAHIVREGPGRYRVQGIEQLADPENTIDCGNAGTGMRLLTGLLVGQKINATLVGDESLMRRPMRRIADPLNAMGAEVRTADSGRPPVEVHASDRLKSSVHTLSVASAQIKSAIILAGLGANGVTEVTEPHRSRDHTERLLAGFGLALDVDDLTVRLEGPQRLNACNVRVPADPSSAAFFAVAATLCPGSDLTLRAVGINPTRSGFLDVLDRMGARIERSAVTHVGGEPVCDLRIRSAPLRGIDVPEAWIARTIDEFPVLFVAAAAASGVTRVRGAHELRVKETDRLAVMADGLEACGVRCALYDDGIDVHGGAITGAEVSSGGDHRIAMAFAVAGIIADRPMTVHDTANVATSFPGFAALAQKAGWRVDEL
ncbi:MAG: 3-phosphoshikimate 1-carboxyvinyltransferase, partial [Pseudomonadota bacterium]